MCETLLLEKLKLFILELGDINIIILKKLGEAILQEPRELGISKVISQKIINYPQIIGVYGFYGKEDLDGEKDKMGIIYKIVNKINGRIYIGQTKQLLKDRFNSHCHSSKNGKSPLYQSFRKYGINNFDIFEIEKCDNNLLNEKEEFYIREYNTLIPRGYNILKGSISQGFSTEWLNSKTFKEARRKQADKLRGRVLTEEHKRNISLSRINNPRVIAANKVNSQIYVKNCLLKKKEKIPKIWKNQWENKKKNYLIIFPDGKEEIVLGLNKFCKLNNLQTSKMAKIARGEKWIKSHKGFVCKEVQTNGKGGNYV